MARGPRCHSPDQRDCGFRSEFDLWGLFQERLHGECICGVRPAPAFTPCRVSKPGLHYAHRRSKNTVALMITAGVECEYFCTDLFRRGSTRSMFRNMSAIPSRFSGSSCSCRKMTWHTISLIPNNARRSARGMHCMPCTWHRKQPHSGRPTALHGAFMCVCWAIYMCVCWFVLPRCGLSRHSFVTTHCVACASCKWLPLRHVVLRI